MYEQSIGVMYSLQRKMAEFQVFLEGAEVLSGGC